SFLSQPDDLRHALAEQWLYGAYEGIERELRDGLRDMLRSGDFADLDRLLELADEGLGTSSLPAARQAAELLCQEMRRLPHGPAGTSSARRVPDALAQQFPRLAQAYAKATTTVERLHAILDHYPVLQLSNYQYPDGQPGWVHGDPELTARNL